ncbi:hypothetical protein [Mycobacterium sp. 3519A]|uniref:hypothetical protein n=1 Tax=Mycobacterium sp. 3519A TaxID=2057184 RepID=UPI00115A55E6|nr:hypothetical protein [Mycobacterium sp. 3519A]
MHAAIRPLATAGVALVGASAIAVTPVAVTPQELTPQVHIPEVQLPQVQLTASIAEIFTFPAFQQFVLNQIDDAVTLGLGLAGSAAGLGQSIAAIPSTLVTTTQQVLTGDLLGALTTVETYLVGSLVAVGEPTLAAIIERRQRVLAVSEAMQAAFPTALIGLGTGVFVAVDGVLRASIIAGQGVVDALLPPNLGNLVNAVVGGTQLVAGSLVDGGQDIVDSIVFAQKTIATALAAKPATSATAFRTEATDVPDLSRKTTMVAVDQSTEKKKESASAEAGPKTTRKSAAKEHKDDSTKPDQNASESPKADAGKKSGDSHKRETKKAGTKKADKESRSEDAAK